MKLRLISLGSRARARALFWRVGTKGVSARWDSYRGLRVAQGCCLVAMTRSAGVHADLTSVSGDFDVF